MAARIVVQLRLVRAVGRLFGHINSRAGNGATDLDFNDNGADTQGLGGDGVDTFYDTGTIKFQIWATLQLDSEGCQVRRVVALVRSSSPSSCRPPPLALRPSTARPQFLRRPCWR